MFLKIRRFLINIFSFRLRLLRKKHQIIVSLTSYPLRINYLEPTLSSLFSQTVLPDKVILWLAASQFENKEDDLPEYLSQFANDKLQIEWCDDLKPHKKYFYALQKYSNDIVIIADDDLVYDCDMIECLLKSYLKFPHAVSAMRTHLMKRNVDRFDFYHNFVKEQNKIIKKPSMQLLATNGAGTLFPPNVFGKSYFDETLIKQLCLSADDFWLKTLEVIYHVPVVQPRKFKRLNTVLTSQEHTLWQTNKTANDKILENIRDWFDTQFGEGAFLSKIFEAPKTLLYFVPHQDDELLTMSVDIRQSLKQKDDVHLILCTDGSQSRVRERLNDGHSCSKHAGEHIYNLSLQDFVQARDFEFIDSCMALGVKRDHIHIPQNRAIDGALTQRHAEDIIKHYLSQFPKDVTLCTIYFKNGKNQHRDHQNLGLAAYHLFKRGFVSKIRFFKEPYCKSKTEFISIKPTKEDEEKISFAIQSYCLWAPEERRYAVGYHSVTNEFDDFQAKMKNHYFERSSIRRLD